MVYIFFFSFFFFYLFLQSSSRQNKYLGVIVCDGGSGDSHTYFRKAFVDSEGKTLNFPSTYPENPVAILSVCGMVGNDGAWPIIESLTGDSIDIVLKEDLLVDEDSDHMDEGVFLMVIEADTVVPLSSS